MASTDAAQATSPSFYDSRLKYFAQSVLLRLKTRSPQLVPLFICVGALPLLLLFSFIAGWIVWSSVPQGWYVPVYLQYGDWTVPYADLEISSLSTTQPYEISLQLKVPATEQNYRIGNFMATLNITTFANDTVAYVRRPAVVLPPLPNIMPLLRSPRLLQLTVPLASSLVTGVSRVRARIELGRKDGWRTLGNAEGREISVYEAMLHGVVHPQGLQRVLAAAPLSFAVAAAIVFFTVSALILAGCLLPSVLQTEPVPLDTGVKREEIEPTSPLEGPSAGSRMRRRSSIKEESDEGESTFSLVGRTESSSDVRRRVRRSSSHDD